MTASQQPRSSRISYQAPVGGMLTEGQKVLNMICTNLSQSGMYVALEEVPPIGSELICNLATAGGRSAVQLKGRITGHQGESGVGIAFVDLSAEQAEELRVIVGEGQDLGEQSAAVYELMQLEAADTAKTVMPAEHSPVEHSPVEHSPVEHSPVEHSPVEPEAEPADLAQVGSPVEKALDDAVDAHIGAAMQEVTPSVFDVEPLPPRIDDAAPPWTERDALQEHSNGEVAPAFLLPQSPPTAKYDSLDEPAFASGGEGLRAALPDEDAELLAASREPRSWLVAAAVGSACALAIGLAGFGVFSSEDSSESKSAAVHDSELDSKRERVLALVEGEDAVRPKASETAPAPAQADHHGHGDPAMGVGGPVFDDEPAVAKEPEKEPEDEPATKAAPKPAPKAPKAAVNSAPEKSSEVHRQVLSGVVVRESGDSFLVRVPLSGSVEDVKPYFMNEPSAVAVNIPGATPKKGFADSLKPTGESVRLIWLRERQGGTHLRVFFRGERPTCEATSAKSELVLRCKR